MNELSKFKLALAQGIKHEHRRWRYVMTTAFGGTNNFLKEEEAEVNKAITDAIENVKKLGVNLNAPSPNTKQPSIKDGIVWTIKEEEASPILIIEDVKLAMSSHDNRLLMERLLDEGYPLEDMSHQKYDLHVFATT